MRSIPQSRPQSSTRRARRSSSARCNAALTRREISHGGSEPRSIFKAAPGAVVPEKCSEPPRLRVKILESRLPDGDAQRLAQGQVLLAHAEDDELLKLLRR